MRAPAGFLTISNTVFTYNYFEVGLITNALAFEKIDSFTFDAQYTTTTSDTCKSFGHSFTTDCFAITITSSTFKKFNYKKILAGFSASVSLAQGMVMALTDFNGLIKISDSTFTRNLASISQYTGDDISKFNCYLPRSDSSEFLRFLINILFFLFPPPPAETTVNPPIPVWSENVDIFATSTHKLSIDKHMRKVLTSKPRRISSLIYLRNFKNSEPLFLQRFLSIIYY
jgi:hypothetical protein